MCMCVVCLYMCPCHPKNMTFSNIIFLRFVLCIFTYIYMYQLIPPMFTMCVNK